MILREINNVKIAVNPKKANQVFLSKKFLSSKENNQTELSPTKICKLISRDLFTPMLMTWELLDKCNFSCSFCYIVGHSNHKIIRFSEIRSHLNNLIDKGLFFCSLSGGEALLHKDFKSIYRFLKESGVLVEIYSNGSLINKEILDLFEEYPPYKIEISIYGTNQQQFNVVTSTNGVNYSLVLENILKLKEKGINVICKTPLNSLTEEEFYKFEDWCQQNNIEFYYSTRIYDAKDGESLNRFSASFDNIITYEKKKKEHIESVFITPLKSNDSNLIKKCYTCGVKNYGFHINSNFELAICSETHIEQATFNIVKLGVEKSLELNRKFVSDHLNKPIKDCVGCEASSSCSMCAALAEPIITNKEIVGFEIPDKSYCNSTRKKHSSIIQTK